MDLLEFIEKANKASDTQALYKLTNQALLSLGYNRTIFTLMTDHNRIGLRAGHGIMDNYPDDWMKHYIAKGFETLDPVISFVFATNGPFLWDVLPDRLNLTDTQEACLFGGIEAGLNNGIAIPLRGPGGAIAGFGAASSDDGELAPYAPQMLHLYASHFYVAHNNLLIDPDKLIPPPPITDRERLCLEHALLGRSNWVTARFLNISEHMVDKHWRKIFYKLGTNSRVCAIFEALNRGIITS